MNRHNSRLLTALTISAAVFAIALATLVTPTASALSGSQFNAGRIIDDYVFTNKNTMSVQAIQDFLNAKVPVCDTNGTQLTSRWNSSAGRYYTRAEWGSLNGEPAPFICLRNYYENPTTKANNLHGAPIPDGAKSAAQLIWDVSQQYSVNPQVLITLVQKEQTLITDDWPWSTQYRSATGYGCPDTSVCNSAYYGFYNQISNAAWQFNRYATNPGSYNTKANRTNYILYSPTTSCGGSNVYVQTQATASLYNYTPYQPNAAAINNLYGSGDSCSSYGNRNFWRMFNDWFGSTFANDSNTAHPNGTLVVGNGTIFLIENDTRRPIANPSVFLSYGYQWNEARTATTGDMNLPMGAVIDTLAPGTLFYTTNSPLYVMDYFGGVLKKQHMSLNSFNVLGYSWADAVYVPPSEVPAATEPGVYVSERHPAGTVVLPYGVGKLFVMNETTKSHIVTPWSFDSNHFDYRKVRGATLSDIYVPEGTQLDMRRGTLLFANGIYVVDYDANGIMKRPVGPWECFNDRWHYSWTNWISIPDYALPARTGPVATC